MAHTANRKVMVCRYDRDPLPGFVQTAGAFPPEAVELLGPDGSLHQIPYTEVKAVCFVRDFETGESWRQHRAFRARPKTAGLWVRLRFRDGDTLEGLIANNLLNVEPAGFSVVPPDPTFQNQRIFVPRAALAAVEVLGVVGSPLRRAKPAPAEERQIRMFD